MNLYETVFIARQDISTADVQKLTDNFIQIVKDLGGKLVKHEYWGLRSLAYEIKRNKKGHYVMMNFDAPNEAMKEMERVMSINEDLLRKAVMRIEEISDKPSSLALSNRNHTGE